jgi:hypothetical protein
MCEHTQTAYCDSATLDVVVYRVLAVCWVTRTARRVLGDTDRAPGAQLEANISPLDCVDLSTLSLT